MVEGGGEKFTGKRRVRDGGIQRREGEGKKERTQIAVAREKEVSRTQS